MRLGELTLHQCREKEGVFFQGHPRNQVGMSNSRTTIEIAALRLKRSKPMSTTQGVLIIVGGSGRTLLVQSKHRVCYSRTIYKDHTPCYLPPTTSHSTRYENPSVGHNRRSWKRMEAHELEKSMEACRSI